jgi:hypothetical protein
MYEIENFSIYYVNTKNEIIRKSDGHIMPIYYRGNSKNQQFVKLKDDTGCWRQISYRKIISVALPPSVPKGFSPVPKYPGLFISTQGIVWSVPSIAHPLGKYLKVYCGKRYAQVACHAYGTLEIHKLLALTFLDSEYLEKGLCVMHLDDDKSNYSLTNLKIGTYSENNKAAYDTGANPSKKQ